jgi:glycine/D-amino acid oxidase-like deaminating enzyme
MNTRKAPTVAVVGGGIVGCMIARELTRRSEEVSVIVIDRDMIGSGATARSAGQHLPRGGTERVRRMAAYSQRYYEKLARCQPALPIRRLDMWIVAARANASRVDETYLESAQLTRVRGPRWGPVRVPREAVVWRGKGCQYADVQALTNILAATLRSRVRFREAVRVSRVRPSARHVALDLGHGEMLTVDRVVVAPGPWLGDPAWSTLVAPLGLRVKKVVAMHVEQRPSEGDGSIVFDDEDAFLLPLHDRGHWLLSYTSSEWDVDPDALEEGISARNLAEAHDCLRRYAPGLLEHCAGGRVFCDAYAPDSAPCVQAIDDAGRVVFAGAANGSGYRLAPAIAAEAADLLGIPWQSRGSGAERSRRRTAPGRPIPR